MDISTLAIAIGYTNKIAKKLEREGFKVQVEQDRSILESTGEEKVLYFLPKESENSKDGYDEYIYANSNWEWVGHTDVDLSAYATKEYVGEEIGKLNYGFSFSIENSMLSLLDQNGNVLDTVDISGRIDLSEATVTLDYNSFTYDGTSKIPSVTSVVLDQDTLTLDTDYTASVSSAINAGSYVLKIYGIGNYKGSIDVNWTINKATPTITGSAAITINTLNETKEETYTTNSNGVFSFTIQNPEYASASTSGGKATITSIAKGNTNLVIDLSEGTNYTSAQELIPLTILDNMCFGVMWNYGTTSPVLTRLTRENDPNHKVTHTPTSEPTAAVETTVGQSWFDNYMPWSGMIRKNYVQGEIVDFVDYNNGETYVYIPQFWSKIVNDTEESKMYFYIASKPIQGFTLHKGSGRYVARYQCNSEFKSVPGTNPKVNTNLTNFRSGITSIDSYHFQYDIHTYSAIKLLYIVEWAHLNSQSMIGAGITNGSVKTLGQTDTLTYHTGRVSGTDNVSGVQYRWIENLWGNVNDWVDGILIQDGAVYICDDETLYSSSITNNYTNTGITTATTNDSFQKTLSSYDDQYIFPKTVEGSDSTYLCDKFNFNTGVRSLLVGGRYGSGSAAGLFYWNSGGSPDDTATNVGGRAMLIDNN